MTKYHFFDVVSRNIKILSDKKIEKTELEKYNQNNNYAVNNVITGNKVQYTFYLDNEKNKNINKLNQKKMIMI